MTRALHGTTTVLQWLDYRQPRPHKLSGLSIAVMSVTAAVVWLLALRLMHISPAGVSEISLMPIPD